MRAHYDLVGRIAIVTRAVVGLMRGQPARTCAVAQHPLRGHVVNIASIQGKEGMGHGHGRGLIRPRKPGCSP